MLKNTRIVSAYHEGKEEGNRCKSQTDLRRPQAPAHRLEANKGEGNGSRKKKKIDMSHACKDIDYGHHLAEQAESKYKVGKWRVRNIKLLH